jgi:hypothetical protein
MKSLIIVSGYARSGTSLMCQMLQAAGLEVITDGRMKADEDNPHGYLESRRVSSLSKDPAADVAFVQENQGKVLKVLCHMLPKLPAGQTYSTIFMVRDPVEIARSVERMNARRMKRQLRVFSPGPHPAIVRAVLRGRAWCKEHAQRSFFVPYRSLVEEPLTTSLQVADFLLLDGGVEEAMAACVDPELYRNRGSGG